MSPCRCTAFGGGGGGRGVRLATPHVDITMHVRVAWGGCRVGVYFVVCVIPEREGVIHCGGVVRVCECVSVHVCI